MLTFEEFFKKKSINLQQLQQAEPILFAEFSRDYPLMGEKSFDYTKKYWFNNLRHLYPLPQAPKPHKVQAEAISQMAVQGVTAAAAQNLDAGIERPKFTEDNLPELVAKNVPEQDVSLAEIEKTIIEDKPEAELATENPPPATENAKPAFKPRFNPKTTNKPETETKAGPATENPKLKTGPEQATEQKPAFKPRFNIQNIKKDVVKTVSETEIQIPETEAEIKAELATENPQPKTEEAKPTYKPRFQMKNIKPAEQKPGATAEQTLDSTPRPATENGHLETGQEQATENPQPSTEE